MIIRVPIPVMGEVIVLTESTDTFEVKCDLKPEGGNVYELRAGTILLLKCGTIGGTLIAYVADLSEDIDISNLVTQLLGFRIETVNATVKYNTFLPYVPQ